ncbi:MAG: flagellar biosynthetic protein FliR [Deltaproteobacteria bacterium]|nr:flagellar biosynthetic protein FliR [Deltaproteobacteria bacterium]
MEVFEKLYEAFGLRGDFADVLLIATLVITRVVPVVFVTPFLGGKVVPPETRIGLAAALAILVFPFAQDAMVGDVPRNAAVFLAMMLKETFIGFVIGFVAAELFYAMEIAGRLLDVMRGSNMAEAQVPELQLRASPIGDYNFQLLLVVFCALNGHGYFIESVAESFRIVPVDGWPVVHNGFGALMDEIIVYTNDIIKTAFLLVFPGLLAVFMVDIVFGMFNRIAPQLNAYFMAMPVKAMTGLAMFMFAMGMMITQMSFQLERALLFGRDIINAFG